MASFSDMKIWCLDLGNYNLKLFKIIIIYIYKNYSQKTKKREYKAKSNAIGISRLYSISKKLFI